MEPSRQEVDGMKGRTVLEFGAAWCPHCQVIQTPLKTLLRTFQDVKHMFIEDGKGRPLGRSYRVTLWPTFVFLQDGCEVCRLVRPTEQELIGGFCVFDGERST